MPPLRSYFQNTEINFQIEILSGLTVAFALVPEAMAFAIIAGLSPLNGLYTACTIGFITSIFGGKPGMISGATGAVAVAIVSLSQAHGSEYIFAAVILAGIIQMIAAILRSDKLIILVSAPVMTGFVNGLAVIIFLSQLNQFKMKDEDAFVWLQGDKLYQLLMLISLTLAIVYAVPRFTKAIPSSLIAILVIYAAVHLFGLETNTIGDIASINGGFPSFHIPALPFSYEMFKIIFPYAFIIASIGLIETALTINILDDITGSSGNSRKEMFAQGIANITTGFFSGMGGCAMLGQSLINVSSGARTRLSGIVASAMLLVFILYCSAIIEDIPMAALTGIMITVSINTFAWSSLKMVNKMPFLDVSISILVSLITVIYHNLALAILVGMILSALAFAWNSTTTLFVTKQPDDKELSLYQISGPLFFGSVKLFIEKFNPDDDLQTIILDFSKSRLYDMSSVMILHKLTLRYEKAGKKIYLSNLSPESLLLLKNANSTVMVNILTD
ncbi:SulP family inorganic anion transporter [Dyadobacter sp. CY345]|uniref:SulP family inorganic anion transporter n=1 Tax=Dyadobacter sp. CY345 TaxID=2909335 RepID=UPI001F2B9DDD|nr:SulP family inorganic anion transporter [Dyadobacter sp. CY345]MCF2446663.1 SulP family inorganic anion transporter [Dyadobacter sp. CY345]